MTYIDQRPNFVASLLPTNAVFAITSNGGNGFATTSTVNHSRTFIDLAASPGAWSWLKAMVLGLTLSLLPQVLFAGDASGIYAADSYQSRVIQGWTVLVHERLLTEQKETTDRALAILQKQLADIVRKVPASAVAALREVPLWVSPEYPGVRPTAEYHPSRDWLIENRREPAMVKGVEFTDVSHFESEARRMPNFTLHELAHGFHDRVLGFDQPDIIAAFERARASGSYDAVERWRGDGRSNIVERAYAMTNHKEYFAEASEAFFFWNDYFPFMRAELHRHDPEMEKLLKRLWNSKPSGVTSPASARLKVRPPPSRLKIPAFYKKYVEAAGYPIVASERVSDYALKEAAYLVNLMLAERPDLRRAMIQSGSRLCIIAHDEFTTDLPEHADMAPKNYWDARARGTGGSETDPYCSCGEENLLAYPGDPYAKENILIHEFAHNIHLRGMVNLDPTFDGRLKQCYERAMARGLWKGKYASMNHHEYFAEGVQSWFDNNRPPDHDHNHVDTRAELIEYDPDLAEMCREVFGQTRLTYTNPRTRLRDHLAGYDPSAAPKFVWPERLKAAREEIRREVQQRIHEAETATLPGQTDASK